MTFGDIPADNLQLNILHNLDNRGVVPACRHDTSPDIYVAPRIQVLDPVPPHISGFSTGLSGGHIRIPILRGLLSNDMDVLECRL